MVQDQELSDTANRELLALGHGQIAYLKKLAAGDLSRFGIDAGDSAIAWGVFSASGETLAICPTAPEAWRIASDHGLVAVNLH